MNRHRKQRISGSSREHGIVACARQQIVHIVMAASASAAAGGRSVGAWRQAPAASAPKAIGIGAYQAWRAIAPASRDIKRQRQRSAQWRRQSKQELEKTWRGGNVARENSMKKPSILGGNNGGNARHFSGGGGKRKWRRRAASRRGENGGVCQSEKPYQWRDIGNCETETSAKASAGSVLSAATARAR
jgi:hypothetical protein